MIDYISLYIDKALQVFYKNYMYIIKPKINIHRS